MLQSTVAWLSHSILLKKKSGQSNSKETKTETEKKETEMKETETKETEKMETAGKSLLKSRKFPRENPHLRTKNKFID